MQFIVRYWVDHPPISFGKGSQDGIGWIDHSSHPPNRLGLHNAILSAEDRLSILRSRHGTVPHGCDIFIESDARSVVLNVAEAEELLGLMRDGSLSWEAFESLLAARSSPAESPARNVMPDNVGGHTREMAEYKGTADLDGYHIDFDA